MKLFQSKSNEIQAAPCPTCGHSCVVSSTAALVCPLCTGGWETWELQFSPLPQPEIRDQVAAWLSRLSAPAVLELVATETGVKIHFLAPPGTAEGAVQAWAALTSQQSRWKRLEKRLFNVEAPLFTWGLESDALLPALTQAGGDLLLATAGQLLDFRREMENRSPKTEDERPDPSPPSPVPWPRSANEVCLRLWLLGQEGVLQEKLRALAAYNYGTETGVNDDAPNPWSLRLSLWRAGLAFGGFVAAFSGGLIAAGWGARPGRPSVSSPAPSCFWWGLPLFVR